MSRPSQEITQANLNHLDLELYKRFLYFDGRYWFDPLFASEMIFIAVSVVHIRLSVVHIPY